MSIYKMVYYVGGASLGGYILLKLVERDPESIRKELPEGHELDYANESKKRSQAFMYVLKSAAAGEDPQTAAKRLKEQMEKTPKTTPTQTS